MFIPKKDIIKELNNVFEPALSEEIAEYNLIEFKKGSRMERREGEVKFIPLLIQGKIKTVRINEKKDIEIYTINKLQSCILTISDAIHNSQFNACAIAEEDSYLIRLPKEKTENWSLKYPSWNKFLISLYEARLKELVYQHEITTKQRDEIAFQNRQITDSIQYASRIQNAVLPPQWYISNILPEHFILFKPRDIVSGDYYWITRLKSDDNFGAVSKDIVIVAAADCTGHGVPGAFMSMLGIALLNQIVIKDKILTASDILNELRLNIKNSLRQTGAIGENKDGMDIALCIFDLTKKELQFAGAYNPLYMIRNNELTEFKGDRMPIGVHLHDNKSFTNNIIYYQPNDKFYIFSDGFADQFGGEKNHKFLSANFKKLLTEINNKPLAEQKRILDQKHEEWKGNREQLDDILVIGIATK